MRRMRAQASKGSKSQRAAHNNAGIAVACVHSMRLLLLLALTAGPASAAARNHAQNTDHLSAVMPRAVGYHPAIRAAAARYVIDPHLLWTIAYLETRFRPGLVSPKGARGMMQFIPATGRRYGLMTTRDLHDPLRSIDAAARYIRDLTALFDGRIDLVLAGYNAGENAVLDWGHRVPPYRETRRYVARGLALLKSISRANILSLERPAQLHSQQARRATCCTGRPVLRQRPVRAERTHTRSVYFPQ
jgi:soluble lytic murein transglycosylase-like protein